MLGSQIIDMNISVSGLDIGVPEIRSFGFARFEKAVPTTDSWSSHRGPELVFMLKGEACWELEDETLTTITGGQFALFPAGKPHRIVHGLYPPSESFWLVLSGPTHSQPSLLTADGLRDFQTYLGRCGLIHAVVPRCLETILELAAIMADDRIYSGSSLLIAEMRAKLHTILIETWKAQDMQRDEPQSDLVAAFLRRLHSDPTAELNIGEEAETLGYSRSYLHSRFRREVGMSPSDYAQRLRIKRCCQRLVVGGESVTDIAMEFGFGSSQYFSRVFRKYLGTTPSEYRTQMQTRGR